MPNVFFTSDLHFGHRNVIRFDNRPFASAEEMDEALITNWNAKVGEEDTVYILGDVSWYSPNKTLEILGRLHGKKILIRGNHDKRWLSPKVSPAFESIHDYLEIKLSDRIHITLCHYPIVFFNRHHYGSYMFYGHVHNSHEWNMTENYKYELQQLDIQCNMFNVGCMIHDYEPKTFEEIVSGHGMEVVPDVD